jgi:hypothetical protein
VIADDECVNFALAVDEQADLTVNLTGKKRYLESQLMADDTLRRNAFAVKPLQLFNLSGTKSCRISEYFIYSRLSRSLCHGLSPAGGAHPAHAGGLRGWMC